MTYEKKIESMVSRYNFTEDQKARFLIRAKIIVDSNIPKDYKVGIIAAVAEYIAREKQREEEFRADAPKKNTP